MESGRRVACQISPNPGLPAVSSGGGHGAGAPDRAARPCRAVFPVSVSVLTDAIRGVKASHAIGLAYGIAGLGNAAGPLIGGLLTDTVGRH